jgi:hypothetical protein
MERGERNAPMQASEGDSMTKRRAKRDTYNYEAFDRNGKKVKIGITKDPERREGQHIASGKRIKQIIYAQYPCSEKTARQREKEAIETYKRNHGRKPRYNKEAFI